MNLVAISVICATVGWLCGFIHGFVVGRKRKCLPLRSLSGQSANMLQLKDNTSEERRTMDPFLETLALITVLLFPACGILSATWILYGPRE